MDNEPLRKAPPLRRALSPCTSGEDTADIPGGRLSKSLGRFDTKWREQQERMEHTVTEFALTLFERESRLCEGEAGVPAEAEDQAEGGKPGAPSQHETFMVTLDADLVRRLRTAADEGRRPLSSVIDSAARDWLEGYEAIKRKRRSLLAGLGVKR